LGTHGCSAAPSLGLRFGVQADRAVRCVSAVSSVAAQVDADMITLLGMSVPIDVKTGRQIRTLVAPSDLQASAHQPHLATGVGAELCAAACNLFAGRCRALHASRNRVRAVGLHRR
jgi:hypothetical protein